MVRAARALTVGLSILAGLGARGAVGSERAEAGEPLVVVAMGTSLTASNPWQPALADRLGACWGRPVQVVPIAESGETSRWGLTQVGRVGALRPAVAVIEFAINDANWRRFVSRAESRDNARAIAGALRSAVPGVRVYLMVTNPVHGLRGAMRPTLGAFFAQYRELAAADGLGLIDTEAAWRALPDAARRRAIPDGVHPTLDGFVEVALPVMVAALTEGRCR